MSFKGFELETNRINVEITLLALGDDFSSGAVSGLKSCDKEVQCRLAGPWKATPCAAMVAK